MNIVLTEINERLTDECVFKDGELWSLNESFVHSQQDLDECKKALMQKEQEVGTMAAELADLVDGEGSVCPNVKDGIIKEFCESPAGSNWFLSFDHAYGKLCSN